MFAAFGAGAIDLFAPFVIFYEFPRTMLRAVRDSRISSTRGREAIELFFRLPIELIGATPLTAPDILLSGYSTAIRMSRSYYDAVFLSTAETLGIPLVTADGRMRNSLHGRTSALLWLGDIQLP
jgi:predicted nucleic acid-binding protein